MELLIRVVDRGGVDLPKGIGDSKAGDVIATCPDGWGWTAAEQTNPAWRIVRVPLTDIEAAALTVTGVGDPSLQPVFKRKMRIDLTAFTGPLKTYLADDSRKAPLFDASTSLAKIRSAVGVRT